MDHLTAVPLLADHLVEAGGPGAEADGEGGQPLVGEAQEVREGQRAFAFGVRHVGITHHADDLFLAPFDGGGAPRNLTSGNKAFDGSPRFSPDGKWIAFTSNRTGNNDVFIVPSTGGEPKQLTWFSGDDQAQGWTPDGKSVIISSARGQGAWGSPLYVQPIDGAIAKPLGMGIARAGVMSPDGSMIAFNRNLPSTWRKEYRGNAAATIAVMDMNTGANSIQEVTNTDLQQFRTFSNNVFPMWGADGMIYFASERDGTFNLWRMPAKGGAAQEVTNFKSGGVFFPIGRAS